MPACCAINCNNRQTAELRITKGITFHKFPDEAKDGERRKRWIANLRRDNLNPKGKRVWICSQHFLQEMFDRTGQTTRLKPDAVPTLFDFPHHLQKSHQPPTQERWRNQPEHRRPKKPRSVWIHTELTEEWRRSLGHYYTLLNIDMREVAEQGLSHDQLMFRNYTRITPEAFLELLDRVGPHITKQDTNYHPALEAGLKLVITLRFLASGDSYHSLKYNFRVAHNTISNFVPEVCRAIYTEMFEDAFKRQMQADDWRAVAKKFQDRWNMPHCSVWVPWTGSTSG